MIRSRKRKFEDQGEIGNCGHTHMAEQTKNTRYLKKRIDLIEMFKMFKGMSGLKVEELFELDDRRGRGRTIKVKKHRFSLDIRKYFFSQ